MLAEAELLRVICALLHCPLPPLVTAKENGSPGKAFGVSGSTVI
jgi:hypothetical protein